MSVQLSAPDDDLLARVRETRGTDDDVQKIARSATFIAAAMKELREVEDVLANFWSRELEVVLNSMVDTAPPDPASLDTD